MPSWPIAMPSSTAIVLNSLATPPAFSISRATSWPRSLRWTWPGTNCVNELTTAMIGLPKSASVMPVARHRLRAPAMLRPWVVVRERYCGIVGLVEGCREDYCLERCPRLRHRRVRHCLLSFKTETRLRDHIEELEPSRWSRDRSSSCHQVRAGTRQSF